MITSKECCEHGCKRTSIFVPCRPMWDPSRNYRGASSAREFLLKGFELSPYLYSSLANINAKSPKIQLCIIKKLTEWCYFSLLFSDIYANTCALVFFLIGSEKLLNKQSLTVEPFMISICLIVFIFRTSIELKSQSAHFFTDIWNLGQVLLIILLSLTVSSMMDNMNGISNINR